MTELRVRIRRFRNGVELPRYMTDGAAGLDLAAALESEITIAPLRRATIPTGIGLSVPRGYEAQIRPRSGLADRAGLTLLNTPGTIDSDFRGEIRVIVVNLGEAPVIVRPGDRIAQMVIGPVARVTWEEVENLDDTERGAGGFGHTGR